MNNSYGDAVMKFFSFSLFISLLFLSLTSGKLMASEPRAYVDKNVVQMGQFIKLSVTTNEKTSGEPDFSVLQNDFEILSGISESSQTQIINGRVSSSKTWAVTITPKKDGAVVIPPITLDNKKTDAITIVVGKAPEKQYSDVFFDTEISSQSVYVQQQIRLDYKLYVRMADISNSKLEELEIENAKIIPIGKATQSQTVKDGIRYYVVESSYFIFPEKSGTLKIPALTYSAVVNEGSRYSRFSNRRRVSAQSDALTIKVKGIPETFPKNATWLPASNVLLAETFSPSEEAKVGEPLTRNIITKATGLPASSLPPAKMETSNLLKVYPDQGNTNETIDKTNLVGTRTDSFALIANDAGSVSLPTYQLPWWDINADKLRYATLDEKQLTVTGSNGLNEGLSANDDNNLAENDDASKISQTKPLDNKTLFILGTAFLFIWIITILAFVFYIRKMKSSFTEAHDISANTIVQEQNLKQSLGNLHDACKRHEAKAIRDALLIWANIYFSQANIQGLQQLARMVGNQTLTEQLNELDQQLYKTGSEAEISKSMEIYESIKNVSKTTQSESRQKRGKQLKALYQN